MRTRKPGRAGIKIRELEICNFKALDHLEMSLPPPLMNGDPDVFVMGSRNGLGKTSVLEACALLFLAAFMPDDELHALRYPEMPIDLFDVMIRAGADKSVIVGKFVANGTEARVQLEITKNKAFKVHGEIELLRQAAHWHKGDRFYTPEAAARFMYSLAGLNPEPLIFPPLIYFHSYRKVQEGNPELGTLVERAPYHRRERFRSRFEYPISTFKLEILRALMSHGDLFEAWDSKQASSTLDELNQLLREYAGGHIGKLRPSPDNTIEFRVEPEDGKESYAFDGLSSGQKEIISTLFLIWRYTSEMPGIVLIDEPELHLNVEWHRGFIRSLHRLAPLNQYIIATHSEDVFASVDDDRRVLLVADAGGRVQ